MNIISVQIKEVESVATKPKKPSRPRYTISAKKKKKVNKKKSKKPSVSKPKAKPAKKPAAKKPAKKKSGNKNTPLLQGPKFGRKQQKKLKPQKGYKSNPMPKRKTGLQKKVKEMSLSELLDIQDTQWEGVPGIKRTIQTRSSAITFSGIKRINNSRYGYPSVKGKILDQKTPDQPPKVYTVEIFGASDPDIPIHQNKHVKCLCSCPDYLYRHSYSLYYHNLAPTRVAINSYPKERNPGLNVTVCKHIVGLGRFIVQNRL